MAMLALQPDWTAIDRSPALPISSSLRTWLEGSWALLFSHPDDFGCYDFESDRWLVVLSQALAAARIRPLALASRHAHRYAGWVTEVGGAVVVSEAEPPRSPRQVLDFDPSVRELRTAIAQTSTRFAMIIDDSLRLRRTFSYTSHHRVPSPLDLAVMAGELRKASRATTSATRGITSSTHARARAGSAAP
jgi:hypothetical protein